jgi:hypothetical protein
MGVEPVVEQAAPLLLVGLDRLLCAVALIAWCTTA